MNAPSHRGQQFAALTRMGWRDDRAAQIVEFAVALPLLVFFVVGIFDFSGAFTLKQKLTNIARDTARVAAADPASDLSNPVPASISDAFQVASNYLAANKINTCGITISSFVPTPPATWTFSGTSNGCVGTGLVVRINRGYYFPAAAGGVPADVNCQHQAGSQTAVISTCVSIQYAYQWQFGRAASLLGSTATLPATISGTAVVMNEN
jgi:Flp pilus assembly protein TadG